MEIINSVYSVVKEIHDSSKSRVLIVQTGDKKLKIINMIKDAELIRGYIEALSGMSEVFVYNGFLCSVADYYEGIDIFDYLDDNPGELMRISLDICVKIMTEALDMSFLYMLADPDCICVLDDGVHINKYFRYLDIADSFFEHDVVVKVQELLLACFDECSVDYINKFELRKYQIGLRNRFDSLLDLYFFVREHADAYEPAEAKDILRKHAEKTREKITALWEKAAPLALVISCVFFIALLYMQILKPVEHSQALHILDAGGISLNEKGAITYEEALP